MSHNNLFHHILKNNNLDDLPLDFIGTKYFGDLYSFKGLLGTGSFGVVLRVLEQKTNREFALKVV